LYQTRDGRVLLALSGRFDFSGYIYEGIWLLELKENAGTLYWENAIYEVVAEFRSVAISGGGHLLYNPSVWDFQNNTNFGIAISYMNFTDGGIYWRGTFISGGPLYGDRIPLIGKNPVENNATWKGRVGYKALSHDTIRSVSGDVIIVFSGMSFVEGKVDYDLWIARSNSTPFWDNTSYYSRATIDGTDEIHPSITQTVTPDHALMVIFEAEGYNPSGTLQITYSKDDGETWRDPEPVTTIPPFAEYIVYPQWGFSLLVLKQNHNVLVRSLISVGPAITAHWEGGFAYSFMAQYHLFSLAYITVAKHTTSVATLGTGYSSSLDSTSTTLKNAGDISAHSGIVENVGGGMTTGGGYISYQGTPIALTLSDDDGGGGGGGSALYYQMNYNPPPIVTYNDPIVTEEESITTYGGSLVAYGADATGTDNPEDDPNTGSGYDGQGGGMAMTHGTNFGGRDFHSSSKNPDRGYYNNIFFGMNPSSNFTLFDFNEARAISTGDSDLDARREIAIASGNQAYLVEVVRTGGSDDPKYQVLNYYQNWHSDGLTTETTDIELYDANGNGFDEVIVSCVEGNVYSFEVINTDIPRTNYLFLDWDPLWFDNDYTSNLENLSPSYDVLIEKSDIGSDGVDDLFVATMDPTASDYAGYPLVRALNGSTGGEIWRFDLSIEGFSKNSVIMTLKSTFLNSNITKDVVILVHDKSDTTTWLFGLNGTTSNILWGPVEFDNVDPDGFNELTLFDLDNDTILDILITFNQTVYWINGFNGVGPTELHSFEDDSWLVEHISTGENSIVLSGRKTNEQNGSVVLLKYNGVTWPVIHGYIRNNSLFGLTATMLDITNDGVEEVLIVESGILFAYESSGNYTQLSNNTFSGARGNYADTLKYDFNSDGYQDVMIQINSLQGFDFEELSQGSLANDTYDGLIFSGGGSGWIAWNTSGQSGDGTPESHSGDMVILNAEANNSIIFEDFASSVSAYFSTDVGYAFSWTAYDIYGSVLDVDQIIAGKATQFVELNDPYTRIYEVRVVGISGIHWVMDDLSYYAEPTKLLAISGLNPEDVLWEYYLWGTHANEISQGDLDRDGESDDLLFITEFTGPAHTGAVSAIDGTFGTPFANIQRTGAVKSVAAGNFGTFGEVAALDGKGRIFMYTYVRREPTKALSVAIQMNGTSSFETRGNIVDMEVGDFNSDGVDDIVFGDTRRYLMALEGTTGAIIWKYRTTSPIMHMAVKDINDDGVKDIAVALESGILLIVDGKDGRYLWQDLLGPIIVNEMEFLDYNGDGEEELAISMGFRFSANIGRFVLYNTTKNTTLGHGNIIWDSYNFFAPFRQFEAADFTNDGIIDFAVALYEHSIWILNGINGQLMNGFLIPVQDFKVGNFTGHSQPQITVIVRNGTLVAYQNDDWLDIAGNTEIDKEFLAQIPFRLSHMAIGDFSGDGIDDIVIRSFANGTYCYTLGSGEFKQLWAFEDRSIFYVGEYQVADLNNDSILDVLTLNYDNIMALSGESTTPTQVVWASFVPTNLILCATVGDFNGDGINDVALGTADHWVYFLYGKEDYLIEQQGGEGGGLVEGNIIIDPNSLSFVRDVSTIIPLGHIKQNKLTPIIIFAIALFVFGACVVVTCSHAVIRKRCQ
jgi:hypothetical protein